MATSDALARWWVLVPVLVVGCKHADAPPRPSDRVIAFADADSVDLPRQAVLLNEGESICVTGATGSLGQLEALEVVTQPTASRPTVCASLSRDRSSTTLVVRNASPWLLRYWALKIVSRSQLALAQPVKAVPPGQTVQETFSHRTQHLALTDMRFELPAPPPREATAPRPQRPETRRFGYSFSGSVGARWVHLDGLDHSLARYGYSPVEDPLQVRGFANEFTIHRFRITLDLSSWKAESRSQADGAPVSVDHFDGGLTAAFDFWRTGDFSAFAVTGPGFAAISVDGTVPGYGEFADRLRGFPEGRVRWTAATWAFELGIDQLIPLLSDSTGTLGVLVGVRTGYLQQLGSSQWVEDDTGLALGGAPKVDVSGGRARVWLGLGGMAF